MAETIRADSPVGRTLPALLVVIPAPRVTFDPLTFTTSQTKPLPIVPVGVIVIPWLQISSRLLCVDPSRLVFAVSSTTGW